MRIRVVERGGLFEHIGSGPAGKPAADEWLPLRLRSLLARPRMGICTGKYERLEVAAAAAGARNCSNGLEPRSRP